MSNNSTKINPDVSDGRTVVNMDVAGSSDTVINSDVHSDEQNFTVVNPAVQNYTIEIPEGTVLAKKYVVQSPLATNTGEANLYLCSYKKKTYVAKVYRRQSAVKTDIAIALQSINSKYVAKLYETGVWNGAPFEILPYYMYGSLEGKTFSFEILRKQIIPALNEGIHALHKHGIIHKDLKPSNIMLCDDQKSVAIIDFGISSIREDGNTVVVTKTGMTPEYSAPETFRNLFLEESDFYSLGITLYELYCGHTPYEGASKEVIEQYVAVQKIPFPDKFPPELKRLIIGLTYNDITNRKDKDNPNRRWTYEEVKKWCDGKSLPLPGDSLQSPEISASTTIPKVTFQHKQYTQLGEYVDALGSDWKNGKRRLYRSLLSAYFKPFDQEIAEYCMDAEEAFQKDKTREDIEFFTLLYKIYPKLESFHFVDYHYASIIELGNILLQGYRSGNEEVHRIADDIIQNRLLSIREKIVNPGDNYKKIAAIEAKYLLAKTHGDQLTMDEQVFLIAYYYSGDKTLVTTKGTFETVEQLVQFGKKLMTSDTKQLDEFSSELIVHIRKRFSYDANEKGTATELAAPQFAAWMTIQGKANVLPK